MTGEVVLSAALRSNLLSLQKTQASIDSVQNVLATGLKVSSALDNPQSFFASQALKNRSSDLSRLLDGIGQSIQTIKAADAGVTGLTKLVQQASSIIDSARDAITNGSKEAAITGAVDLSGVTSTGATGGITGVTGVDNTGASELAFTVKKADGTAVTLTNVGANGAGTVKLAVGDSIDQIIGKINDLVNSATGEAVLHAELTSAGYLKINALDGGTFSVAFDYNGAGAADTATASTADQSLASALGFGATALQTVAGVAAASQVYQVAVTALPTTSLESGVFYKNGNTGFADASDLLTAVDDTDTGGTARFVASATETTGINITVNGSKSLSAKINITGTTIQGLVDKINTDTSIGSLITASYDKTTGKLSITADDASVHTVKIFVDGVTDSAATSKADFDFGTATSFTPGATASIDTGETFTLASAASTLSQYENDYNTVRTQIDQLVSDSDYRGVNLIKGDTLDTYFNEDRTNKLSTIGQDLTSSGLGVLSADFSRLDTIETASSQTADALTKLRSFGGTLSNSLSIIQTRQDFTSSLIDTLDEGSDKLTVADQNEEGAKLLALQTRQQLGVTALSLAAQAQQSVLRLF